MNKKPIYKSYVLVIKQDDKITEIDWTKIKEYKSLSKKKYKLEQIDYFTSHFINKEELLIFLFNAGIISKEQIKNARFWIYPAKQNKVTKIIDGKEKKVSAPEYASEHLQHGIAYSGHKELLKEDLYVMHLLETKLNDVEFINYLYNKYVTYGKYNDAVITNLKADIERCKENMRNAYGNEYQKLDGIRKSKIHQLIDIQESYSLLNSIRRYAYAKHNGEYTSQEEDISVRNNIREFYLREKYIVTGCQDALNDERRLTFERDAEGYRKVNYLKFHNLIMTIKAQIDGVEKKRIEEARRAKYEIEHDEHNPFYYKSEHSGKQKVIKKEVPDGQLSLFDFGLNNNKKN